MASKSKVSVIQSSSSNSTDVDGEKQSESTNIGYKVDHMEVTETAATAAAQTDSLKDSSGATKNETKDSAKISKQLLYSEKYKQCYEDNHFAMVGKSAESEKSSSKTFSVPQSSVLSKAKDFLSLMSQSNTTLSAQLAQCPEAREAVDVTATSDHQPHIEMDLMFVPSENIGDSNSDDSSSTEDEIESVSKCLDYISNGASESSENKTGLDSQKLKLPKQKSEKVSHNPVIKELHSDDLVNR